MLRLAIRKRQLRNTAAAGVVVEFAPEESMGMRPDRASESRLHHCLAVRKPRPRSIAAAAVGAAAGALVVPAPDRASARQLLQHLPWPG